MKVIAMKPISGGRSQVKYSTELGFEAVTTGICPRFSSLTGGKVYELSKMNPRVINAIATFLCSSNSLADKKGNWFDPVYYLFLQRKWPLRNKKKQPIDRIHL